MRAGRSIGEPNAQTRRSVERAAWTLRGSAYQRQPTGGDGGVPEGSHGPCAAAGLVRGANGPAGKEICQDQRIHVGMEILGPCAAMSDGGSRLERVELRGCRWGHAGPSSPHPPDEAG